MDIVKEKFTHLPQKSTLDSAPLIFFINRLITLVNNMSIYNPFDIS